MKKIILLMLISTNVYADADSIWLAKTIYHEIRGGDIRDKQAVALTVLNRKVKKKTTFKQVVTQRGQYDFYKKRLKIDKKSKEWKDALAFTDDFLANPPKDFTNGSTFFHNRKIKPDWDMKKIKRTVKIHDHIFYKERV